jgi:hypothetical protein
VAVDTTTFDSAAASAELSRSLEQHRAAMSDRVSPPASSPLLKLGQDGSVLDRHGRVLLAKKEPPK